MSERITNEYINYLMNEYGLTYSKDLDSDGKPSPFPRGTRIQYKNKTGTVMAQVLHYNDNETFWGDVILLMDDGEKVYTNSWMIKKGE